VPWSPRVTGTASFLLGFISTLMAAIIGYVVGQAYDGTLVPLSSAYLVLALATIAIISVTEKGRFLR
jgi:MFS transporter, DHA1 family, multidrug resistance protein